MGMAGGAQDVELTMIDIRRGSALLADLETSGAIKIAGAMYNLETGASSSSLDGTQLPRPGAARGGLEPVPGRA